MRGAGGDPLWEELNEVNLSHTQGADWASEGPCDRAYKEQREPQR